MKILFVTFVIYTAFVVLFVLFQIFSVVRFATVVKRAHAVYLIDFGYALVMIVFHVVCFFFLLDSIYCVFKNFAMFSDGFLPFSVGTMPLITCLSSLMLKEGMFAYTSDRLYGGKRIWNLENVIDVAVEYNAPFRRTKITLTFNNLEEIVVRTSMSKYKKFKKAIYK